MEIHRMRTRSSQIRAYSMKGR